LEFQVESEKKHKQGFLYYKKKYESLVQEHEEVLRQNKELRLVRKQKKWESRYWIRWRLGLHETQDKTIFMKI